MPIGIGVREQLGEKENLKCSELSGWVDRFNFEVKSSSEIENF